MLNFMPIVYLKAYERFSDIRRQLRKKCKVSFFSTQWTGRLLNYMSNDHFYNVDVENKCNAHSYH